MHLYLDRLEAKQTPGEPLTVSESVGADRHDCCCFPRRVNCREDHLRQFGIPLLHRSDFAIEPDGMLPLCIPFSLFLMVRYSTNLILCVIPLIAGLPSAYRLPFCPSYTGHIWHGLGMGGCFGSRLGEW